MAGRPALLIGYFGRGNAGDEWIAETLRDRLGRDRVTVARVSRPNPFRLARAVRRSGGVVLGGGELFQTRTSVRSLLFYLFFPWTARVFGRPVAAHGVSVDPDLPPFWRALVCRSLRGAALWVRDGFSHDVFQRAGLAPGLAADTVWSRGTWGGGPPAALRRVLWIPRFSRRGGEIPVLGERLNALHALTGWETGFLGLHPEEDAAGMGRLRAGLTFFHRGHAARGWEEVRDVMGGYDLVVSMRYHGLVAAALARRPAAAWAAHGKVRGLAGELGFPLLDAGGAGWAETLRRAFARGVPDVHDRVLSARAGLDGLSRWVEGRIGGGVPEAKTALKL